MFCPHKPAAPTGNKDEMAGLSCWQWLKNLRELAGEPSNHTSMISAVLRLFRFREPVRVEYRAGQFYLDGLPQTLRGPETPGEASQLWGDLAREFAEDAELLAERIEG